PELESSYRESMAESVLDRFSMEQSIPTKTLQDYSKAFYDKIKANWAPTKIIKHYPIRYREEGRRLETVLDMVLETKSGLVLIHLDGSSGKQKSKSTKEAVAILQYAKSAVAQDYGQMVTEALVGFTMLGEFRGI
ncbi:MAG: hypothetical protein ACI956_002509, partial [Nonlabens sp.]